MIDHCAVPQEQSKACCNLTADFTFNREILSLKGDKQTQTSPHYIGDILAKMSIEVEHYFVLHFANPL